MTPPSKPAPTGVSMDKDKRNWMVATAVVGGAGVAAVAVPFVSTFQPSKKPKPLAQL